MGSGVGDEGHSRRRPESVLSIERIKSSICDHLFQRVHSSLAQ
jgi:hypothetical protein